MERIKLNLIPSGVAPIVHLSQYDDGRKFGIDLFEGESVYVLDGTETLTVNSRKPDGHVVVLTVTNTGTSSLDVDTVEQLTAVHGVSYAKLQIVKGSVTIATLPFLIDVSRDPLENGDPSESFIQNLHTQIAEGVAEEVAEQYDSGNVIFDNEPTENHGIGYTVTSEGIKTAIDNAFDYDNTASGSLVHIEDGADNIPVKSLVSQIVAVQSGSGTPSPSTPLPIQSFTQANVTLAEKYIRVTPTTPQTYSQNGIDVITYANGRIEINGTATSSVTINIDISEFTAFDDDTRKINFNNDFASSNAYVYFRNGSTNVDSWSMTSLYRTYTNYGTLANKYVNRIAIVIASGTTISNGSMMIEFIVMDTATTHTINFGQSVFGGRLNVTTGELTITMSQLIDLGDFTWVNDGNGQASVSSAQPAYLFLGDVICDSYQGINSVTLTDNTIAITNSQLYPIIRVKDTVNIPDSASASDIKTFMTGKKACFELATPITVQLTPTEVKTLLGENNIFSNTGDVEVNYYTNKSNDILEFIDSEIGKKNGTNIPIEENSQDSIKTYVDDEVSSINTSLSNKANKTEDTTITLTSGYSLISSSCGKTDRLVHLNFNVEKSGGFATGWQAIGTTEFKPNTLAYCPLWNVTNGVGNGEVRIDTDGTINFYIVTAGELRLNANIGYITD